MTFSIIINTVNDAALFVSTCSQFDCEIDYKYERYIVDAKSLMSVLAAGLGEVRFVYINTYHKRTIDKFSEAIELWKVGC